MSVSSSVLLASFISISMSILMIEAELGDMEHDAVELVSEKEGNNVSLLPTRKLLMLPSRLLDETRREALLGGGEGMGPSSAINIGCGGACCCN